MASPASKLKWGQAAGVYLAQDQVTMTIVASTPQGPHPVSTHTRPVGEKTPEAVLKDLFESTLSARQRKRMPICLGIEPERTFFSTTPAQQHVEELSANDVLSACRAGDVSHSNSVVDFVEHHAKTVSTWSVAACPRKIAESICRVVQDARVENCRFEPAAWSLANIRHLRHELPKRWKYVLRIIANEESGIAILSADSRPLIWRRFGGNGPLDAKTLASTIRLIDIHARERVGLEQIDGIIIQGVSSDLQHDIEPFISTPLHAVDGDSLSPESFAMALAMSAKKPGEKPLNMLRPLLPPPSLLSMVPAKLAALVIMGVAGMGLTLWDECGKLKQDYHTLKTQNAQHTWAQNETTQAINADCKELQLEVDAIDAFLRTRILWSNYLRDLPTRMPPNACLLDIHGFAELKELGKRKHKRVVNKSLTLRGITRFTDREIAPLEVDAFLESLRNVELLQEDFPFVTLAEIQWRKEGFDEVALFSVVALPEKD